LSVDIFTINQNLL